MIDKLTKFFLFGILVCLIAIACKPTPTYYQTMPAPQVNFDNGEQVIQLAPNRIAVVDSRTLSGTRGQVLVYDYDETAKKFTYACTFNYTGDLNYPRG